MTVSEKLTLRQRLRAADRELRAAAQFARIKGDSDTADWALAKADEIRTAHDAIEVKP